MLPKSHKLLLCVFLLTAGGCYAQVAYRYGETSELINNTEDMPMRIRGIRNRGNKDFVIGGVFAVHEDAGGVVCGKTRRDQWLEAMLFAVDSVNANKTLLPNITLGFDIRDSCFSENIGLDEAIDVIISGNQLNVESCGFEFTNNMGARNVSIPTIGIVGAAASRVSIPVASLGRLFEVPQVSFGSTSPILNNRDTYTYFYRTVPPDNLQAQAMIDIVLHFNWNYISIIYVGDAYGQPGAAELRRLAMNNNICIDVDIEISSSFTNEDYQELAKVINNSHANVVIVFSHEHNARLLLQAVTNSSSHRRFTWIASDGWANTLGLAHMFNETVAGYFSITQHAHAPLFDEYLSQLTIQTNIRNPWFEEILSAFTSCNSSKPCKKNISLTSLPSYAQDNLVPSMIDAVYAFANALHNYLEENCNFTSGWTWANQRCPGQKMELNSSTLLQYLRRVNFVNPITGNSVDFDRLGNAAGRYEILNYQAQLSNGVIEYGYQRVGTWSSSRINSSESDPLELFDNVTLQFGVNSSEGIVFQPPIAQCGHCSLGEHRRPTESCCSVCDPCLGQHYSDDPSAPSCNNCSVLGDMWGNNPLRGSNGCVAIAETFLKFSDPWSIVVIIMGILGLLSVAATGIVFGKYYRTPVIKSSSREQMILLLIAIGLSFASIFIYIAPPTFGVCIVQRVAIWFCFSLMFGTIMIKILRVFRVFQNKSLIKRPRFMEAYHQIIFSFLFVLGQMVLVFVSIGMQLPGIQRELRLNSTDMNDFPEIVVTCVTDPIPLFILSGVYETLIIIAACVLGVMSFKYPANYNEAKFIAFCSFALLMIWLAFIPSYFATLSTREIQNATIAFAVTMSAFAVLFCIFGRKLYIVLLRPKENKRQFTSQFTKTSDCTTAIGSLTIESAVTFAGHDPMKGPSLDIDEPVEIHSNEQAILDFNHCDMSNTSQDQEDNQKLQFESCKCNAETQQPQSQEDESSLSTVARSDGDVNSSETS